jgi:NAD+ kinase
VTRANCRVLFIYKKSAYQVHVRERKNDHIKQLIDRDDRTVRQIIAADTAHAETLDEARRAMEELGVKGVFRYRSDDGVTEGFELIVTIGGDGTLLWAAHRVPEGVPVLAINSAPQHSVGYFCGGHNGRVTEAIAAALENRHKATRLTRMQVEIDGEIVHKRVLNDALFCHKSPAATTRYIIRHGDVEESQKSSGLWIGPAAGSTAAQRSAGGQVLPPGSRKIQYVVREPYHPPEGSYRLRRGLLVNGEDLRIYSQVREGRMYIDGPRILHDIGMGTEVRFSRSDEPLTLLAFPGANR